jgi:arylformamidase
LKIRVIDLTREMFDEMETWPGNKAGVRLEQTASVERDGYQVSRFRVLECHSGTHLDSPLHFVKGGVDLAGIPLKIHPTVVVHSSVDKIGKEQFEGNADLEGRAILIHTGWDRYVGTPNFYRNFPILTPEGAQFLADHQIAVLGTDTPSLDPPNSSDHPAHRILLNANIPIVEGLLHLAQIPPEREDPYFVAFPLRVSGVEACPVRAAVLLFSEEEATG